MVQSVYKAPDIECEGCANAIRRALESVAGIESVDVDIDRKIVKVEALETAYESVVIDVLDRAGFPAERIAD